MDESGDQVTEFDNGNWAHSNIWAGGKLVATYDYNNGKGGIHYELADPLGTKRVQANALGQMDETCTSLPFGNDVNNPIGANCTLVANSLSTADDATEHHFTGKERDTESGNDYFFARYYASALGRFTTPDWSAKTDPVPYAVFTDPQSLNLYSYVRNNPLSRTDPDGHADPTKEEIIMELKKLADAYNVPRTTVLAVAKTESNFKIDAKNDNIKTDPVTGKKYVASTDYGLMQINSTRIGIDRVTGADGKQFTIGDNVKTDWKANADVGVATIAAAYKRATTEQPQGTEETRSQQVYSSYNAGPGNRDRFSLPGGGNPLVYPDHTTWFQDERDANYLANYYLAKQGGIDQ